MAVTENLIQGAGRIFVAPFGSTLPVAADLADLKAGTFTDFTDVGHTTSGVRVEDTPSTVEARSQQAARVLDSATASWDTRITSTAREVTLAMIAKLANSTVSSATVSGGTNTVSPKFSVAIVGPWGDGADCMIVAERCTMASGLQLEFSSESFTELPFTLTVLEGVTLVNAWKLYEI